MKRSKILLLISLPVLLVIFIIACKKNTVIITNPPLQSSFAGNASGAYYIKNDASSTFKVPIGLTTISDKDTKITVAVSSPTGATAGTQYTLPSNTVTIPAGKVEDSITVKGLFAGYPGSRRDTLNFTISGGDVPATIYNSSYTLIMQKYCDVLLSAFNGAYSQCTDVQGSFSGSYATNIVSATSTGATSATIVIKNFAAAAFGPFGATDSSFNRGISVNIDWSNPAKFTTSIPSQPLYKDPTYGNATIKGVGTGSFSSCDNTFSFSYTVTVAAGTFGNFTATMAK
jgi:hypothetical protein